MIRICIIISISLLISSCASNRHSINDNISLQKIALKETDPLLLAKKEIHKAESSKRYLGHYKVGKPYKIKGKTYKPKEHKSYDKTGIASWYGVKDGFHGNITANGDIFNKESLTAAHKTLPLPCMVKVINLKNKKSLVLMVNDRGPFHKDRIIDVSEKAARILEFRNKGVEKVRVLYLADETKKLLAELSLPKQHGKIASKEMRDPKCNTVCYLHKKNKIPYKKQLLLKPNLSEEIDYHDIQLSGLTPASNNKGIYLEAGGFSYLKDVQNFISALKSKIKNSVVRKENLYYISLGPIDDERTFNNLASSARKISSVTMKKVQK